MAGSQTILCAKAAALNRGTNSAQCLLVLVIHVFETTVKLSVDTLWHSVHCECNVQVSQLLLENNWLNWPGNIWLNWLNLLNWPGLDFWFLPNAGKGAVSIIDM